MSFTCVLPSSAICEKDGYMYLHQEQKKSLKKFLCHVKENTFMYSGITKDSNPEMVLNILGGAVRILETKLLDKTGIEIIVVPGVSEISHLSSEQIRMHPDRQRLCFYVDSIDEANKWISILIRSESMYNDSEEHNRVMILYPKLKDMPEPYRRALIWQKLRASALRFDFSIESQASKRDIKQSCLLEILDAIETLPELISDPCTFQEIIHCLALCLFRVQPKENSTKVEIKEESDLIFYSDTEWPHISICYSILYKIVESNQINPVMRKHNLSSAFVSRLILLFDSLDQRERESLKTITHRIYGKLTNRRAAIRKAMNQTFYEFLYETKRHYGISELLEILASIINGFTVPLREEHIDALNHSLIPLHKMYQFCDYAVHLSYCMNLYVSKEKTLAAPIFQGILRYWPHGNSTKEMLFINEIEDLLEPLSPTEIVSFRDPLFKRIARCISNSNNQIAERALYLWSNESINGIIMNDRDNCTAIACIIYPSLRKAAMESTSQSVKQLANHIIQLFNNADPALSEQLRDQYDESQKTE